MAKTCVSEKTASRQKWIEQGLQEMMRQKKYSDITVTELCGYLSLSRRSFYRYFDSLEDVLNSLLDHTFQNLAIVPEKPELEDLRQCYEYWVEQKDFLDALHNGGQLEKLFEYTIRYTTFETAASGEPSRETQLFLIGGFMSLIVSWYSEGFRKTPEQMACISHKMLYEPFMK